jgi:hypothetical protein
MRVHLCSSKWQWLLVAIFVLVDNSDSWLFQRGFCHSARASVSIVNY